jgi:uncharacterized protein (TIGR03435 family)
MMEALAPSKRIILTICCARKPARSPYTSGFDARLHRPLRVSSVSSRDRLAEVRHLGWLLFAVALFAGGGHAQPPKFEVAAIKPSTLLPREYPGGPHYVLTPSRVDLQAVSLKVLITVAYGVEAFQVSAPEWALLTRFDILAKPPQGAAKDQLPGMIRNLLEERFHAKVHQEMRETAVYALVVAKDGPKLNDADPNAPGPDQQRPPKKGLVAITHTENGVITVSASSGKTLLETDCASMLDLARYLRNYFDLPLVDRTGLTGLYQFSFEVAPPGLIGGRRGALADAFPADAASDPGGVSIFASIQKLGLRIEKRKAPLEHIVVDAIDKSPTSN